MQRAAARSCERHAVTRRALTCSVAVAVTGTAPCPIRGCRGGMVRLHVRPRESSKGVLGSSCPADQERVVRTPAASCVCGVQDGLLLLLLCKGLA